MKHLDDELPHHETTLRPSPGPVAHRFEAPLAILSMLLFRPAVVKAAAATPHGQWPKGCTWPPKSLSAEWNAAVSRLSA
jgi:hypothetical protein